MEKNKKKSGSSLVLRPVIFLLIFCLLFTWCSYLLRPVDVYRETIAGYYAEPKDTIDVVYIGGSVCFKYWIPLNAWNDYGYTSYNFATDAIPPQLIKYYVIEALKSQSPSLLILDVRPFEFGDALVDRGVRYMDREASLRRGIDSFDYSINRTNMIRYGVPDHYPKLEYYFDIAKYHENVNQLSRESWEYSLNRFPSDSKGYTILTESVSAEQNDYHTVTAQKPLSPVMEELLIDLMDYLKGLDMQVLFIVAPYSLADENEQMMHNYMSKIITGQGFGFLDGNQYYDDLGLDFETDFFDRNHVNTLGALKYTEFLSGYLKDHYSFEDKRNNAAYDSWNQDYQLFLKDIEQATKELRTQAGTDA